MATNWKVVSPNGVEIGGLTEGAAKAKAKELNAPRYGCPARHWSKRWVVTQEAA